MGFLDSILGKEEEGTFEETGAPFKVSLSFVPLRLTANKKNSVSLVVKVTNLTNEEKLVSVDALLPPKSLLGFDQMCINKSIEKRLGKLQPRKTEEAQIEIWANNQTKIGSHPIEVRTYAHYLNYKKVINYVRKKTVLRVT